MKNPPKILIVEDEGIVAFNLQQRLQQLGYAVIGPAESDADSLALVARERPDLVLMDIHIKGELDGIELASMLGRDYQLPIIYLTAYSEDATLERARRTRPYGYLIKPFSERELHATVQMALERHEVQSALAVSQTLLEQALQAAEMGVIHIRPDIGKIRMNGSPAPLAGLRADEERTLDEFVSRIDPDDRAQFIADCQRGSLRRRTVRLDNEAGSVHWLQIDAASNDDGLLQGMAQNVTDREEARTALQRANDDLEDRVRERTAELRQHMREIESFSHAAAHDLRSPIRAISGLSQLLHETHGATLGEEGRDLLGRISRSAKRMAELIDALLGLSTLSRTPMTPADVDLAEVAREVAQSLRETEPDRQVSFVIADHAYAHADLPLIRSVIENLMRNAWKFTRDRQPAVIEFGLDSRNGRPDYFVRDNGVGFDNNQAEKLFGAFFRLHDEQHYGGFGLGLSIAERIVRRHGGTIRAEGEVGQGATIHFTLGG
ncbi:MAG: response regulator [Hydrogenophaga sp.]|uniref:sensor histidine kinase n=1 Tax=Hydrogenophaga sp. TaxID=1904254 RepID=UPI001D7431BC|nr:hybrid sensor histidine kinase/response regulator [Hydrogenophaga sp.]MBX3611324.1 response regulator [Hydrogenophaga sp.]